MITNTIQLVEEYLLQGGYSPGINSDALFDEAEAISHLPEILTLLARARNHLECSNYAGEEDELINQINSILAKLGEE